MRGGGGSFRRYRFQADLRRRAGAWLGVAVVIGLSAGLALALVAGARRSDSAVQRFVDTPDAHQTLVVNGIPGTFDFASVDFDDVASLPGVAHTETLAVLAAAGQTEDGVLVDTPSVNFMADASGRMGRDVSPFKYLAGRPADPADPDEVVAAFRTAEAFDLEVGSTIDVNLLSPARRSGPARRRRHVEPLDDPRRRVGLWGCRRDRCTGGAARGRGRR